MGIVRIVTARAKRVRVGDYSAKAAKIGCHRLMRFISTFSEKSHQTAAE